MLRSSKMKIAPGLAGLAEGAVMRWGLVLGQLVCTWEDLMQGLL
jgi:hypothetical protein